jgi:hypothetical protein
MPKIDTDFPWGDSKALDASPERVVALPASCGKVAFFGGFDFFTAS